MTARSRSSSALRSRRGAFGLSGPLALLLGYLTIVALFGGGSRDDIQSLILLRPFTVVLAGYALWSAKGAALRPIAIPLGLLAGFMALHLLQLIPLPPEIWRDLPQREVLYRTAELAGQEDSWRPLTLSPAKTWNSFFALFAPLAALLFTARVEPGERTKIFAWIVGLALVSSIFGILQLLGAAEGPFYFYSVTNEGYPVGLFANRNHQSVLLACAILVCFWYLGAGDRQGRGGAATLLLAAIVILFLIAVVLVTGSRAGLGLSALAAVLGVFLASRSGVTNGTIVIGRRNISRQWLLAGFGVLLAGLVLVAVLLARDAAVSRLMTQSFSEDMRFAVIPVLQEMGAAFIGLGAGLGSFELAYKFYEPLDLIQPRYLNEAHNDWAQLVIEGGIPALALLLAMTIWLGIKFGRGFKRLREPGSHLTPGLWVIFALGTASILDYPLRVPSLAAIFAVMVAIVAAQPAGGRSSSAQGTSD